MELGLIAGGLAAHELFSYNRENFMFDKEQRIEREYQGQDMRIKQFNLYREDVEDLVNLTVGKMDVYLVVNTLQLGFCITLYCEGRLSNNTPTFVLGLFVMHIIGAFTYLALSIWLCMHASIAAHAFGVRLLTQFVRLPVAGSKELEAARAAAEDYEGLSVKDLLRIPVWKEQIKRYKALLSDQTIEDTNAASEAGESEAPTVASRSSTPSTALSQIKHIQAIRKLQCNWMSYDAYGRVAMVMGSNQILFATAYYTMAILSFEDNVNNPTLASIVLFSEIAYILAKLEITFKGKVQGCLIFAVLMLGPLFAFAALWQPYYLKPASADQKKEPDSIDAYSKPLIIMAFLVHTLWILLILIFARAHSVDDVCLPTMFRTVLYLDVFGWLDPNNRGGGRLQRSSRTEQSEAPSAAARQTAALRKSCQALAKALRKDLEMWNSQRVRMAISEDAPLQRRILKVQNEMEVQVSRIQGGGASLRSVEFASSAAASSSETSQEVFVLLSYWDGAETSEYYYPVFGESSDAIWPRLLGDEETVISRLEGAKILTIDSLEQRIEQLKYNISHLLEALDVQANEATCAEDLATVEEEQDPDKDNPAQVHAFGGQQAVGATRVAHSAAFQHTAAPSASFHPFAPGGVRGTTSRGQSKRKPGQVAWRLFWQGSSVLLVLWIGMTVAAIGDYIIGWKLPVTPREPHGPEAAVLGPLHAELLFDGPWPHPFFKPLGVVHHAFLGENIVVADRFALHVLPMRGEDQNSTALRNSLKACFSAEAKVRAKGIDGISITCQAPGRMESCAALLLLKGGHAALRCPLKLPGISPAPQLLQAPAGVPWRALAFTEGSLESLWGQEESPDGRMALTLYESPLSGGSVASIMPVNELPLATGQALQALQPMSNRIYGLAADGSLLYAWPFTRDGETSRSWSLPNATMKWTALSVSHGNSNQIYFAGIGLKGSGEIWRLSLPTEKIEL